MGAKSLVLIGVLLASFLSGSLVLVKPAEGGGFVENVEEFEDNVVFEKVYLDNPTWKKSFSKDLGGYRGKLSGTVYLSLGRCYIRLPTKIKARYDTCIEPFTTNEVEMAAEPYNGEGLEFEYVFGFNLSVTYDPYGPECVTGKVGVGDFDTGFNFEGDFTPPLQGESVLTSAETFKASIGIREILDVQIGIEARYRIYGYEIWGDYYENDPYATANDVGSHGIVLGNAYSPQFNIKDTDIYTSQDGYVDFGAYNLNYEVDYVVEIAPMIGFSILGVSWWWTLPLWTPISSAGDNIPVNADDSDDTDYQMSRLFIPGGGPGVGGYGLPIFDVGPSPPISATPGFTFEATLPVRHVVVNPPPGYTIPDTTMEVHFENGTLAKTIPVTQADFANGNVSTTLSLPATFEAENEYESFEFSLIFPDLSPWYINVVGTPLSVKAMVAVASRLPDLNVVGEWFRGSGPGFLPGYLGLYQSLEAEILVTVSNDGGVVSPPTSVSLWLYEGMPTVPAYGNVSILIASSILIGTEPVSALLARSSQLLLFFYPIPPSMENKTLAFIVQVDGLQLVPEVSEENNVAFTTAEIVDSSVGRRWILAFTNSSFRSLGFTYGTSNGFLVSDLAAAAAMNETAYTEPATFVDAMDSIVQAELLVDEELVGLVPDVLLTKYETSVTALNVTIGDVKSAGNYTQLEVLEIMDLQRDVIDHADRMWSGSVSGLVVDESSGNPLGGVEINVSGNTSTPFVATQSNENGTFTIPFLYQGNYTLNASKFGYENTSQPIVVNPASTTNVSINLATITGMLEINITDEITDEPVNAAAITVTSKQAFRENFENGSFSGWSFYYSSNSAQSGSLPPGTWNSSIVSDASALSESYSARFYADSDAWASPWRVDAAVNRTFNRDGAPTLGATLKFDDIQGSGGVGHSYFIIIVYNAANTSRWVSYGFSTTGDFGGMNYTVNPGDEVHFERNVAADYFDKYGETLPNEVMFHLQASADYAEGWGERRTTAVRVDNIYVIGPYVRRGVTSNGIVSFAEILPGNYTITVEKANYVTSEENASVYSQAETTMQVALSPLPIHDVAVISLHYPKFVVPEGYAINLTVKVGNEGMWIETFNVTVCANATTIGKQFVALARNNVTTFTLQWTGSSKGSYNISAAADVVFGEIDVADNELGDAWVFVTIPGDVDGDRDVDIFDIVAMAGAYGSKVSDPGYNPNYDIDGDGDIDIFDIVAAAGNYGESW
ncbi:carboxypeptidase-like regulatory domain-containing protein [Candidatus Bathyarchaeota archaeon]|nr:carboxypeptidase-like regulatory domain-containing protein [Candidatus Bathyarchaeota archaeon]